ncbi:hypothetical protein [Acinetobacter pittii]|uniref:hypothetical protein n=1 Tax=Acinetobacter pittii TaxID=48296 RepID=UPI0023808401|nr:hypothetical protein [Acinetobacter pittii]MDE4040393.1 hypothetical protein [Acinetobacter pittii]
MNVQDLTYILSLLSMGIGALYIIYFMINRFLKLNTVKIFIKTLRAIADVEQSTTIVFTKVNTKSDAIKMSLLDSYKNEEEIQKNKSVKQ